MAGRVMFPIELNNKGGKIYKIANLTKRGEHGPGRGEIFGKGRNLLTMLGGASILVVYLLRPLERRL